MTKIRTYETFVPLYITNECDGRCVVCNMRKQNTKLRRISPDKDGIERQLKILYQVECIRAVCILTGEYATRERRLQNLDLVIWTMKRAFEIGFEKVFFNIGSPLA